MDIHIFYAVRDKVRMGRRCAFQLAGKSRVGACPWGVLERWSATENVNGAPEPSEKKGWSARVLELRKTSWSAGKLGKIGWSHGDLILNCLERWSVRQKIAGAWSRGMYWSAGALKEKEVEL